VAVVGLYLKVQPNLKSRRGNTQRKENIEICNDWVGRLLRWKGQECSNSVHKN